jgi:hypothetical protein
MELAQNEQAATADKDKQEAIADFVSAPAHDAVGLAQALSHARCEVLGKRAVISDGLFGDLNVFGDHGSDYSDGPSVLDAMDGSHLLGSREYLKRLLAAPTQSHSTLLRRQASLRAVAAALEAHGAEVRGRLEAMARLERHVLWLFRESTPGAASPLLDAVFFTGSAFERLNDVPEALTATIFYQAVVVPVVGVLAPIAYLIVPWLVMRSASGFPVSFELYLRICLAYVADPHNRLSRLAGMAMSALLHVYTLATSIDESATLQRVCGAIVEHVAGAREFLGHAARVEELLGAKACDGWFKMRPDATDMRGTGHECREPPPGWAGGELQGDDLSAWRFAAEQLERFRPAAFLFGNFGGALADFRAFDRRAHGAALNRVYALDCIASLAALQASGVLSPARLLRAGGDRPPSFAATSLRHPSLRRDAAVANDVAWRGGRTGILVTGPNAGGKSTLLRAVMLAALLAQTATLVPAASLEVTTFGFLGCSITRRDSADLSLFQSEMHVLQGFLERVRAARKERDMHASPASLVVLDEIFSSTNPVEGIACAYAVAKNMVQGGTCLAMVATHFTYLAKLAAEAGNPYANMQMPLKAPGPYRLVPGVCREFAALDMLSRGALGAHGSVVADATAVKDRLTRPRRRRRTQQARAV